MTDAQACPGAVCESGEVFPTSGTIPVNHFQLAWHRLNGNVLTPDRLRVIRVADEQPDAGPSPSSDAGADGGVVPGQLQLEVSAEDRALVTTSEALAEGDVLRVDYSAGVCDDPENDRILSAEGTITLGPAAELPTELGTLDVATGEGNVDLRIGMCDDWTWLAYAVIDVELTDSARPFADMFMYDVEVDGQLMPREFSDQALLLQGAAWPSTLGGRNAYGDKVLITADCTADPNEKDPDGMATPLTAGTYSVAVVATLPDGTRIASDVVSVTLRCSAPVCQDDSYPWLDHPCQEGELENEDAGPRDGGSSTAIESDADTTTSTDSDAALGTTQGPESVSTNAAAPTVDAAILGVDGGDTPESQQPKPVDASGCICTLGTAESKRPPVAWAALLLGLLLWKRRESGARRRPANASVSIR